MPNKINDPIVDEFLKAFDIDVKVDDSGEQEEYANITESDESFDELSSQFKNESIGMQDKGTCLEGSGSKENIIDAVHKICNTKLVKGEEFNNEEESKDDIEYDRIDIIENEKNNNEDVEENNNGKNEENNNEDVVEENNIEEIEENNIEDVEEKICTDKKDNYQELKVEYNPNFEWVLESPSPMYAKFYNMKMASLCKSLVGGEKINFDKIEKEIASYMVDVTSETFDQREVDSKMQEAISYRERLMQISVRVNSQYHKFKEEYESLKGVLARVEYLKPAKRQDGLEYEHLGDIQNYLSRLEALHTTLSQMDKILSEVYQMLSRKVSMYMESKVREVYDNTGFAIKRNESPHKHINTNYDQLPSNANVSNDKSGGIKDWANL